MKPIIIATLLLGIVAALLFWKQEKNRKIQATEVITLRDSLAQYQNLHAQGQDSLRFYQLAHKAHRLLLNGELDSAKQLTIALDKLQGGKRWQSQLTNERLKRDSFSRKVMTLQQGLHEANNRLQETEQLNGAALQEISAQMKEIQGQANMIATLRDSAQQLKEAYFKTNEQLTSLEKKYAQLNFKNAAGLSIRYFGETTDGKADGFGMGVVSSKGIYEGNWGNNQRHGQGIYTWANGDRYEGQFVADKKDGFGIYYFSSGERYEGEWKNDLREGLGSMYDKTGKILLSGEWKADKLIDKKPL